MAQIRGQRKLPLEYPPSNRVDAVHEGAKAYAAAQGRTYSDKGLDQTQVNSARGYRQFQEYQGAMDAPTTPGMRKSYEALRSETNAQYDYMTKPKEHGGMGVKVEVPDQYPYKSHEDMFNDVRTNNRIQVQSSKSTNSTHEMFSQDENDKFRAVHDVFGHAAIGRSFSRHGEEAAYLSHAQMYSPEARPALASETRGQNSYMNFNPNEGHFVGDQRMVNMPKWASRNGRVPPPTPRAKRKRLSGSQFPPPPQLPFT